MSGFRANCNSSYIPRPRPRPGNIYGDPLPKSWLGLDPLVSVLCVVFHIAALQATHQPAYCVLGPLPFIHETLVLDSIRIVASAS